MQKITEIFADFAVQTKYNDLPENVIHEMKRVILDSLGCAIAGFSTERGSIAAQLARKLAGPRESSIIGTHDKVSSVNAAFANGELMSALDFDAMSPASHDVPILIASAVSMAEKQGISGKDLILALAISFEISKRFQTPVMGSPITEGPNKGALNWAKVLGWGNTTLAAAAGAGKILGLDQGKLSNAIGIAGYILPPNVGKKFLDTSPVRMSKYGLAGWAAQAGITAALLADIGYTGDTDLFDGETGFWAYTGQEHGKTEEELTAELGKDWCGYQISYKQYPCGYCIAGVIDKFIEIMEDNGLEPFDIETVSIQPVPIAQFNFAIKNELKEPEDYCFYPSFLFACAAYKINPTRWHHSDVKQDPRIREYMEWIKPKIRRTIDENDFSLAKQEDPRSMQTRIEVTAKGKTYKEKKVHPKGGWYSDEFRNTDEELKRKFTDNVFSYLTGEKAEKAAKTILELEKVDHLAKLMEILAR